MWKNSLNFIFVWFALTWFSQIQAFIPTSNLNAHSKYDATVATGVSTFSTTASSTRKSPFQLFSSASSPGFIANDGDVNANGNAVTTGSTGTDDVDMSTDKMHPLKVKITKAGMMSFVASMCIALPATLYPVRLLHKARIISTLQKEQLSCRVGCFCSRWLMRLIPFANVKVIRDSATTNSNDKGNDAEPTIWVCNHTSMLDIFFLLAKDKKLRGKNKRPIKIIYWKDLEKNPVTKLLFTMSGFIPVEMEDNGNGNTNTYKKSSFKTLLKSIKKAFDDGFDIGILPEGQLNPTPEKGLQPIFGGAFTLSRMSKRPIKMMAIHGLHKLWHGDENIGMTVTGRKVTMRNYNLGGKYANSGEFVEAFSNIVGHFGATGTDYPDWKDFMNGSAKKKEEDEVKQPQQFYEI